MNLYGLAAIGAAVVALRYLTPRARRKRLERTKTLYEAWIRNPAGDREAMREVLELEAGVVARTIRSAPVDPSRLSFFDGADRHPYLAEGEVPVLENFLVPREVIRREYMAALSVALHHYRDQERAARNPITWLKWIAFAPRDVLDYLGLQTPRTRLLVTGVQLVYWIGALVALGLWAWQRFGLAQYLPS